MDGALFLQISEETLSGLSVQRKFWPQLFKSWIVLSTGGRLLKDWLALTVG